jgi:hypothetical protein
LSDRRIYRTVVPSRVFMEEGEEFPMQEDSFSVPTRGSSDTTSSSRDDSSPKSLRSRSLLESFDAVQYL